MALFDHTATLGKLFKRVVETETLPNGTVVDIEDGEIYTWGLNGVDNSENLFFTHALYYSFAVVVGVILIARILMFVNAQLRLMCVATSTGTDSQRYWAVPRSQWIPLLKKHVLYAPLFRNRHNREIQLSSAVNMGTLPTRMQTFLLLAYFICNVCYCTLLLDWSQPKAPLVAEFRGRTGVMATVNMVPLFLLAGRNNPLIYILRISFDTYNLMHRWLGRIVVLEAICHTCAWMINKVDASGWAGVWHKLQTSPFIITGTIATGCFIFLLTHSPSPVRHAFYETFLHLHIAAAVVAVVCVYLHLKIDNLPYQNFYQWVVILWVFDRTARLLRIFYRNVARNMTKATIEALPGGACRVTITCPRPWTFIPGSHLYLYLPSISLWTSHPFSIAWDEHVPEMDSLSMEKLPTFEGEMTMPMKHTMSLIVSKKKGMTESLYKRAMAAPNKTFTTRALVEGPYGGLHSMDSYGTVLLIAGGVGITHMVPLCRHLLRGYAEQTVATRKMVLIWSVRDREQLEWVRPWMDVILAMPKRREVLKILLFVTRPKSAVETISPSASVQMHPGRPNFDTLLEAELPTRAGTMGVTVCGGGSISDSVRAAVRRKVEVANIDFIEESFTW